MDVLPTASVMWTGSGEWARVDEVVWFVREAVLDAAIDDYACARFEVDHPMLGRADVQGHWCLPPRGSSYCTDGREM